MESGNVIVKGSLKTPCNFCGAPAPSNADGILGTGICLTQACKDRVAAQAAADSALKQAQAEALAAIGQPKTGSPLGTTAIIIIVVAILILAIGLYFILRKK